MTWHCGWWDYEDGPSPAMINRYTGERVIREGPLAPGIAPSDEPWFRFEYHGDDLVYPLAVRWTPETGKIIIDHNRSAEMWHRETNATADVPPFGTHARVDDIVPDAIWCWPGLLDMYFERRRPLPVDHAWRRVHWNSALLASVTETLPSIVRVGGWTNARWERGLVSEDVFDLFYSGLTGHVGIVFNLEEFEGKATIPDDISEASFHSFYADAVQLRARSVLSPFAGARAPWRAGDGFDESAEYPAFVRERVAGMRQALSSWKNKRLLRPTPFAMTADGGSFAFPATGDWYGTYYPKWDCDYLIDGRHAPGRPGVIPPREEMRYVSKRSGISRTETILFEFDSFSDYPRTDEKGLSEFPSFEDAVKGSPSLYLTQILDRDFRDAVFQWKGLGNLSDRYDNDNGRLSAKTECVAHFSKFLGGRAVQGRGQITYFVNV